MKLDNSEECSSNHSIAFVRVAIISNIKDVLYLHDFVADLRNGKLNAETGDWHSIGTLDGPHDSIAFAQDGSDNFHFINGNNENETRGFYG